MSSDLEELRRESHQLLERRRRGDLRDKDFQRRVTELSVALSRCVAGERLSEGEAILAEHHVVYSHLKLTQSVLKEPEQVTASFFASDRRLILVKSIMAPDRPVTCDAEDNTSIVELPYAQIREVSWQRQWRWGEAMTGLLVMLGAFVLGDLLAITGPLLMLLGFAGMVHGLLFPTRWIEFAVVGVDASGAEPIQLHGPRRASARRLLAAIQRAKAELAASGLRCAEPDVSLEPVRGGGGAAT